MISLKHDPGTALLSATELATLESVYTAHAGKDNWRLVGETHRLPEYVDFYVAGTSKPIPYESLLRHSGRPEDFSLNRPVISPNTLAHMVRRSRFLKQIFEMRPFEI